jgi:hypothetical protein
MSVLHPSGFVETGSCSGPRYTRNQPSRETPGVLLNEITDKYVVEFNVPFRNATRSLKELKSNWDRLDPNQKKSIIDMLGPYYMELVDSKNAQMAKMAQDQQAPKIDDITVFLDSFYSPGGPDGSYTANELAVIRHDIENWTLKKHWYLFFIIAILSIVVIALLVRPRRPSL